MTIVCGSSERVKIPVDVVVIVMRPFVIRTAVGAFLQSAGHLSDFFAIFVLNEFSEEF